MDDQPTCGKGLAEHAVLPAKLGELIVSVAGVLEAHMPALDLTDAPFRSEGELVLGAFEPQEQGPLLRLELISNFPVPAAITAPRVMAGSAWSLLGAMRLMARASRVARRFPHRAGGTDV
jgi:hypothetical protein